MKKIKTLPLPVEAAEPEESWRVIDIPVWKSQTFIYVGPFDRFLDRLKNDAGWTDAKIKEIKEETDKVEDGDGHAYTVWSGGATAIWSPYKMEPEVLVHELYHAVVALMRSRMVEDDEAFAYTLEYLYKEATK